MRVKSWIMVCMIVLAMAGCHSKEKSQQSAVQDPALVKQASVKLIQQGIEFLNARDIPKAVVSFQGAIQVDPSNLQPYMILSEIYLRLKSYPDALGILERAANKFPDNGFVFYMLSVANQEGNNILPAVLAARRSAELFKAQNNEEGYQRSMVMMEALIRSQQQLQLNGQPTKAIELNSSMSGSDVVNPIEKK